MNSNQQTTSQLSCHYQQIRDSLAGCSYQYVFNFCTQRIAQVESVKKICCIPETYAKLDEEISNLEKILNERIPKRA